MGLQIRPIKSTAIITIDGYDDEEYYLLNKTDFNKLQQLLNDIEGD